MILATTLSVDLFGCIESRGSGGASERHCTATSRTCIVGGVGQSLLDQLASEVIQLAKVVTRVSDLVWLVAQPSNSF